jgi:RNA polymerase sigma factor (sigma-70 family)
VRVKETRVGTTSTSVDELYRRHSPEALRVARAITRNADDAADAVAEAFAGVLRAMAQGRLADPDAFRPYLLAATRNASLDVLRRTGRTAPSGEEATFDRVETRVGPSDRLVAGEDGAMAAEAFAGLPERWRAVLWLTEVERLSPSDAAPLLRLTPNNVSQLALRARGRLRERYVQLHVRNHATGDCLEATERLGALVAGELTPTQETRVRGHLAECVDCRERLAELEDIGLTLRRASAPVWLALLSRRRGRRWPWSPGRSSRFIPNSVAGVDPSAPAALVNFGSSPAVQQVAAAVAAGLLVVGAGTAVVRHDPAPAPERRPPVELALPAPSAPADPAPPATTSTTEPSTTTTAAPATTTSTVAAGAAPAPAAPAALAPFVPRGRLASAPSSLVAHSLVPELAVFDAPGASTASRALAHPQRSGAPLVLLVTEQRTGWLQVLLPVRPNGSTGWVRTQDVSLATHNFRIVVELSAHRITAYQGTEVLLSEPIGVGTADAPTPGGLYYTKELFEPLDSAGRVDRTGPYGPYAYGLSGFSEVIFDFGGGDGQFGIHGTNDPSGLGRDVSHGCIRMSNAGITLLARTLPLGVPVDILP